MLGSHLRHAARRLAPAALALGALSLSIAGGASAADGAQQVLPAAAGQQALAIRVAPGGITARVCAAGACSPDGGKALEVPAEARALLGAARVRAVALADGKS